MPPVLDVALNELPRCGPENLRPCHGSLRHHERHNVLELIAKAVRAICLIQPRSRPDAAGKGLIEQPAVEQHVHGLIGCGHLHRAKYVIPVLNGGL
jgi:hypothetical protein